MWTYQDSKPYAEKIGGKIVGSVKSKGKSNHDLDILVNTYSNKIENILNSMGFIYMGSQVVSPSEIKKSRKFAGRSNIWLRNHRFENSTDGRVIEVWNVDIT